MKVINHSIIGSGLSALMRYYIHPKSSIFSSNNNKLLKGSRFYEKLNIGGNTNIWGGYINFKLYKYLKKNKRFCKFCKNQKLFKIRKLFNHNNFKNTYYISNYSNKKVLRINRNHFSNLFKKKINKISIVNKNIILHTKNKKIPTSKLSICIGNLSLIKLLFNSKILKLKDKISFLDGNVSYGFNFNLNEEKNYYIPMTILEILEKLIKGKKIKYNKKINKTLFVQIFSKKYKKYTYSTQELLTRKNYYIRFFLSNHPTNLLINNIPLNDYIKKFSKKINIYNSGTIKNYLSGPISQNLIFNAITK
tara:strand:- start:2110 stop:3027 length:918 start_codon:yes stop_codon:yes gene_type:complete